MFNYDKIYQKSVYKENVNEYLSTWKDAVTKKRIFELVPHIDNLSEQTLEELRCKWQDQDVNNYSNFIRSLLHSFDGFEALKLFNLIYLSYKNRDDRALMEAIQCLHMHLRLYPTLISFFPQNLMLFLNLLKKKENPYTPNIIFVSKERHKLSCHECGNRKNMDYVKCLCSQLFLCKGCQNKENGKCSICKFAYTIKS